MSLSHEKRCCALQALVQADLGGVTDFSLLRSAFEARAQETRDPAAPMDHECDFTLAAVRDGIAWATAVWSVRDEADAAVRALAPEWPTHRQPSIDRNILRLGYWEIRHARIPLALAIDEAVELAKAYGTDRSPSFINAVLDAVGKPKSAAEHSEESTVEPEIM
ncbi:MAG: transcription antitermination factor NusB [Phycisphaerales bacterium]|nr:transcription antitermination factor NusB [Phycisphaerales bacterium]